MISNNFIKKFKVDTSYLTKEELKVLDKLVEAAELVDQVYKHQLSQGFYPKNATKQEIEKAFTKDPAILSPYTMVERDKGGKLIAIPYHQKYRELLEPIAQKLQEAARVPVRHKDFSHALKVQAEALLTGKYNQAQVSWMKINPYLMDIVIGPIERVEDTLFFTKRSYQAWVGLMDQTVTSRINTLKEIVFTARRQVMFLEKVDFMKKAQLRAEETIIFSGMIANYNYTATTLPNEMELLEKNGSEGWIFLSSVRDNFEHRHYKIFQSIFAPHFKGSFTKEDLFRGYLLLVAMHEIARILLRYRFSVDRLRELWPTFNEATVETLAIKMAGTLLLKDVISQKEMEAMLVMFLTRLFDGYVEILEHKTAFEALVMGNAAMLNSLLESGALKISSEGMSWPNFTKMFISVSELADLMEKIVAEGSYGDAQGYLKKQSSLAVFKNFSSALKSLH